MFSGARADAGVHEFTPPMHRDYRDRPDRWHRPEIHRDARIERDVIVEYGIAAPTRIGASWIMHRVTVGHDATIGDGCEIATGTVVGAHSVVEDGARLGIGVIVKPFRRVGAGAVVGLGAVVTKDVPPGETWISSVAAARMASPPQRAVWAANDSMSESELAGWEEIAAGRERAETLGLAAAAGISPEDWSEWEASWARRRDA
jgi:acetyltransferase-like isoleucine patch superfamily enzyme